MTSRPGFPGLLLSLGIAAATAGLSGNVRARPVDQDRLLEAAANGNIALLEAGVGSIRDPARAVLARLLIASSRLDDAAARAALESYVELDDRNNAHQVLAWSTAAGSAFAAGDYRQARLDAMRWLEFLKAVPGTSDTDAVNLFSIASALSSEPAQAIVSRSPASARTSRDAADLLRSAVSINGISDEAVLDTGANLSTLSASMAARLHVRMLDADASLGSATRAAIGVKVGMADRLEIAGLTLSSVAFLVVPDEQLKMPIAGYQLDIIIGFPVFRAMGRVQFASNGSFSSLRSDAAPGQESNLRFNGNSMYVTTRVGGRYANLQVDTGARQSSLSAHFALANKPVLTGLKRKVIRVASAGGSATSRVALWNGVPVKVGGCATTLPVVAIDLPGKEDSGETDGTLGQDVLQSFDTYTMDFLDLKFSTTAKGC